MHTHHNAPANDGVGPIQWNLCIQDVHIHHTISTCHHVAQVPSMSYRVIRATMFLVVGVKVRASADTPSSVVTKLMDVESMVPWLETSDLAAHLCLIALINITYIEGFEPYI